MILNYMSKTKSDKLTIDVTLSYILKSKYTKTSISR